MTERASPSDPRISCSVLASAGTGKTWQLVARLTRLLLAGADPGTILAITFTRKAAGEMQTRLNERLRELMEADDAQLDRMLSAIGEPRIDAALRDTARGLLETRLRGERTLRATTFHSFCQDLLQRFPLEAGLPPGFELAEQTGALIGESWDAVFAEATRAPGSRLADALQYLFSALNGMHNTRAALVGFIDHRSDWWAYTRGAREPVAAATARLRRALKIDAKTADGEPLLGADGQAKLAEFHDLLARHTTTGNLRHADQLQAALHADGDRPARLAAIRAVFLTERGEPRKRKASKTQGKAMSDAGQARFLELHEEICTALALIDEHRNRRTTHDANAAWYLAGNTMLQQFQRIKRERRLLDFADLEWHAFELLNHPDQAHWIQYKMDERIDHLLIDEFQDTNPTQWRLIQPLLEEMAAGGERQRSLFVVGDAKQSIYRFRRGNPRLLGFAADWMSRHLDAPQVHLDSSRRSSPLVMDTVNAVFGQAALRELFEDFQTHSTHLEQQWGRLELWPLIDNAEEDELHTQDAALRNPLSRPRPHKSDRRHFREGQAIAARIVELLDAALARPGDILLLLRSRTHLPDYEAALRERGIPYLSQDRGTLLESLEIRDLEALLKVLMTPQDNLSLAQVLRSPIFSASDDDLLALSAPGSGSWFERLIDTAATLEDTHPLARAARLLAAWHRQAGRVPIHDLLESIFHQANLPERYRRAFPAAQVPRIRANLTRFVELALEVDAGRYPTLPRFLETLRQLRSLDKEGPSQATPQSEDGQRVRILTIHASKGLEAPIVFLADSAATPSGSPACQTLVRWEAEDERPDTFMLLNRSRERDAYSRQRLEFEQREALRESANLLYVALTRARNMLVISGCRSNRRTATPDWYRLTANALTGDAEPAETFVQTFAELATVAATPPPADAAFAVDPRLSGPVTVTPAWREIAPSRVSPSPEHPAGDEEGLLRGRTIHRLLQLGSEQPDWRARKARLLARVANEQGLSGDDPQLEAWWSEVAAVLEAPSLERLMRPTEGVNAYNEVPVSYRLGGQTVFGIVDRLLVDGADVLVVDYKTHRIETPQQVDALCQHYREQLALYREGVQRLYPGAQVRCCLLFTSNRQRVDIV